MSPMTDLDIEVTLDQTGGLRGMLVEAAFDDDRVWNQTFRFAGIKGDEASEIRAYLVEAYGPKPTVDHRSGTDDSPTSVS